MSRITANQLRKHYRGRLALRGVSFTVSPGEIFAYLGPNGAGKTTTIRLLTGLARPSAGQALIDGHDPLREPAAKRRVGVVAQTINLDQELTVAQNLDIHGRLFGLPRAVRQGRIRELLTRFGLEDRAGDLVMRLSGGLKRRVMIARALLHAPVALFLDEPTVGLDADIRRAIWGMIKDIQAQGAAIFLTTHYIEEAEALADRVAFLRQGEIVALGSPSELVAAKGAWACLELTGQAPTRFFADRETALAQAAASDGEITVRRTMLEDAYLETMREPDVPGEPSPAPVAHAQSHGRRA